MASNGAQGDITANSGERKVAFITGITGQVFNNQINVTYKYISCKYVSDNRDVDKILIDGWKLKFGNTHVV